jgi:cytochrome c peroxidase
MCRGGLTGLWLAATILVLASCGKEENTPTPKFAYSQLIPSGFPMPAIPADNEPTPERIALGKALFYDPVLSADSTKSCASCHRQSLSFADDVAFSEGIMARKASRNAPSLANVAYQQKLLREGGLSTLEMQVLVPVQEHNEFDFNLLQVAKKLRANTVYVDMAKKAYNREPDEYVITRAIASFERTLLSGNSPYHQHLLQHKTDAMGPDALRGMDLFFGEKLKCGSCHEGWLLTNQGYANNGLYLQYSDPGRKRLTGKEEDDAVFKIPSLLNVSLTAPYMFDGSLPTLSAVIEHYASGGYAHVNKHANIRAFVLTQSEKADLLAFLQSLTDTDFVNNPDFSKP